VWRETANPVPKIGDSRVEAGRIAGRDRVGDRPVDRDPAAEFLPGQVAHRDYQIAFALDLAEGPGSRPSGCRPGRQDWNCWKTRLPPRPGCT
jgi:hypothetical protein